MVPFRLLINTNPDTTATSTYIINKNNNSADKKNNYKQQGKTSTSTISTATTHMKYGKLYHFF